MISVLAFDFRGDIVIGFLPAMGDEPDDTDNGCEDQAVNDEITGKGNEGCVQFFGEKVIACPNKSDTNNSQNVRCTEGNPGIPAGHSRYETQKRGNLPAVIKGRECAESIVCLPCLVLHFIIQLVFLPAGCHGACPSFHEVVV